MRENTVDQRGDKQKTEQDTVHFFLEKEQRHTYYQEKETTVEGQW